MDGTFEGMDTLLAILHNVSPNATAFLTQAMTDTSYEIFNESQVQCPVRFGVLKASGHVEPPDVNDNSIEINIGYGGAAAEYALFVHENLAAQHAAPTKAKFLEDPMNDAFAALTKRLQGRMEGAILTQYPQAPAAGVTTETTAATSVYHRGSGTGARHALATSKAMTMDQVRKALASGSRRMQRAR